MRQLGQQAEMATDDQAPLQKMRQIDSKIDSEFNVVRGHLRTVQARHDVLRRMRDTLKKLGDAVLPQQRVNLETELLNDYNYLRTKTRQDSKNASSALKSDSSPYSRRRDEDILSTQTDYERFLDKWDKVLKSGTADSGLQYLNEYATLLLKRDDPAMAAVKRLHTAAFELRQIELKAPIMRGDIGDRFSFRNRIYNKQNERGKKAQREVQAMLEEQYRWLKDMKI